VAEDKRIKEGEKAFSQVLTNTIMTIPEFANSPDLKASVINYLKETWLPLARTGIRSKGSPYESYITGKSSAKTIRDIAIAEISKFTDLSPKSVKKLGAIVSGVASLVEKGQVEIPSQKIVNREDTTVEAGGYANIVDDIYRASLTGTFKDTFGSGIDVTGGVSTSYTPEGVSIDQARIGAEAPFLGGTLSGEVSGNPYEQQARVNYTLPLKKGGKVTKKRKKRKTKKYTKGCAVRTAKY
jgi:hypothetical protein